MATIINTPKAAAPNPFGAAVNDRGVIARVSVPREAERARDIVAEKEQRFVGAEKEQLKRVLAIKQEALALVAEAVDDVFGVTKEDGVLPVLQEAAMRLTLTADSSGRAPILNAKGDNPFAILNRMYDMRIRATGAAGIQWASVRGEALVSNMAGMLLTVTRPTLTYAPQGTSEPYLAITGDVVALHGPPGALWSVRLDVVSTPIDPGTFTANAVDDYGSGYGGGYGGGYDSGYGTDGINQSQL